MNKSYIKFLVIPAIIFGAALNSNIGYSMESINNNSTNEYEINTSSNTTNNIPQQLNIPAQNVSAQNNQINNIQGPVNYKSAELIKTLRKLFTTTIYVENKNRNSTTQEIRNCIENIKDFYKSNDINTLRQLTQLVHNTINNSWRLKTNMIDNINELQKEKVIKNTDCEELLKFNLFLNIITNIENKDKKAWTHKSENKWSMMPHPVVIDGKTWYVSKYDIKGEPYETLLENETELIIQELTEVLINKYFVLDDPNTWIPKDKLVSKIKNDIKDTCQYIDELQITKQMLNNKDNQSNFDCYSILDNISYVNARISDTIDEFFAKQEVENRLVAELKNAFKQAKIDKMYGKYSRQDNRENTFILNNIKSKYIRDGIYSYAPKLGKKTTEKNSKNVIQDKRNAVLKNESSEDTLARYQALPKGLFDNPNGIPAIVLSYLHDKLEDGQTWILPNVISDYIEKYNLMPQPKEESSEEDNNESNSEDDRD